MTKNLMIGLSAAALALTGASAALAGEGRRGGDGDRTVTRAEAETRGAEMFARMDVNKDGKLDAADRSARQAEHFTRLDTNKDGQLSREEFAAGRPDRPAAGERGERRERMGRRGRHGGRGGMMILRMADANKDGAITQAEFTAAHARHFDMVDTNKDGSISPEERKAARDKMRAMHGRHGGQPEGA